ncbi:MAG TPA: hypothetical protein VEY51_01345 [Chondromyces sp.]|nr:hypothetical protein [Chondromyces sp.]
MIKINMKRSESEQIAAFINVDAAGLEYMANRIIMWSGVATNRESNPITNYRFQQNGMIGFDSGGQELYYAQLTGAPTPRSISCTKVILLIQLTEGSEWERIELHPE